MRVPYRLIVKINRMKKIHTFAFAKLAQTMLAHRKQQDICDKRNGKNT